MTEDEKKERSVAVAEHIKVLFTFCYQLIDDLDLIEEAGQQSENSAIMAVTLAPVMGAVGMDYDESHFMAMIKAKRAKALAGLIRTLKTTQQDIEERKDKNELLEGHRQQLRKALGES